MTETVRTPIQAVPPPARSLTPLVEASPCFDEAELAQIIADGLSLPLAKGQVTAIERAAKARNSTIALFPNEPRHSWMVERIARVVNLVNRQHWGFELAGSERLQFSAYGAGEHYDWHIDLGAQHHFAQRKISISILLNDPAEYDGGDLEVSIGSDNKVCARSKGAVILFPSYALHRVTPVTSGTRYSLVAWIVGATPFR